MRIGIRAGLWMLLALAGAAPAAAQRGVPALPLGDSVRVALTAADPVLREWGSYRAFRFQALPDHLYQFTARADSGRVGLRVARLAGVLTDYVASSGSGGGGVSRSGRSLEVDGPADGVAALRFRAPQPGVYLLVLSSPDTAALTLHARELSPRPPEPRPLAVGGRARGELNAGSGWSLEAGGGEQVYDLYTVSARRGQRLNVASGTAGVLLGRLRDGAFQEIPFNDTTPSGGVLAIPDDGEYAVRVFAALAGEEGVPYTVWLGDAAARPAPRRLEQGRAEESRFDPAAAVPAGGDLVDQWVVHGRAGERLQISARSTEFDTYLILGRVRGDGWEMLAADDDSGEGTDSRIDYQVPESGDYLVRVRPFSTVPDSAAPYTVLVEQEQEIDFSGSGITRRARPETRPVRWGARLTGTLDEADAAAEDGSAYDAWTFSATAGERIVITLRSDAFDAYLAVGRDEGGEWMELTSNDDAAEGSLHARVVMLAPDTGEYTIRVNTFPGQPAGPYTLTVER